jgi:hypothetical protein
MILHTHSDVEQEDGSVVDLHVAHATPYEAKMLADAIYAALESNPDAESYAITLGRVEDVTNHTDEPGSGLILPPGGLATP